MGITTSTRSTKIRATPEWRPDCSWYDEYGLDLTDFNVETEDPDNDGFSNIVEYKNEPVGVRYDAKDSIGQVDQPDRRQEPSRVPGPPAAAEIRDAAVPHPVHRIPAAQRQNALPAATSRT